MVSSYILHFYASFLGLVSQHRMFTSIWRHTIDGWKPEAVDRSSSEVFTHNLLVPWTSECPFGNKTKHLCCQLSASGMSSSFLLWNKWHLVNSMYKPRFGHLATRSPQPYVGDVGLPWVWKHVLENHWNHVLLDRDLQVVNHRGFKPKSKVNAEVFAESSVNHLGPSGLQLLMEEIQTTHLGCKPCK